MQVIYRERLIDKLLKVVTEASRTGAEIEKFILTEVECNRIKLELGVVWFGDEKYGAAYCRSILGVPFEVKG